MLHLYFKDMRKYIHYQGFILLLIISMQTFTSSCNKKEQIIDCTDPNAINYNPEATSIPGSDLAHCIFDTSCHDLINIPLGDTINYPVDTYTIDSAYLIDNYLSISVSYAGGCEEHLFNLYTEDNFCGTPPCYIYLTLSHESNNDLCEAIMRENLCFDVSIFSSDDCFLSLYDTENNTYIQL